MGGEKVSRLSSFSARQPSPRGRGWLRSSRVRGHGLWALGNRRRARFFSPDGRRKPVVAGSDEQSQPLSFGSSAGCSDMARTFSCLTPHPTPRRGATFSLWEKESHTEIVVYWEKDRSLSASFQSRQRRSGPPTAGDVRRAADFLQNPVEPFFHFVVREPQLEIAVAFDRFSTLRVGKRLIGMMLAVELDRQTEVVAAEVDDVSGDRRLPAKFQAVEPRTAQFAPENGFGPCARSSKSSRERCCPSRHARRFASALAKCKARSLKAERGSLFLDCFASLAMTQSRGVGYHG